MVLFSPCSVCLDTHEYAYFVCCILTNTLNDKGARTRVNEWLRAFEDYYPGSRQTSLMSMFRSSFAVVVVSMTFRLLYVCVRNSYSIPFCGTHSLSSSLWFDLRQIIVISLSFGIPHCTIWNSVTSPAAAFCLIWNFIFNKIKQLFCILSNATLMCQHRILC